MMPWRVEKQETQPWKARRGKRNTQRKEKPQTFLVILVEVLTVDDGIILDGSVEMSLFILMAGELGPSGRTRFSIIAFVCTIMTVKSSGDALFL